MDPRTFDRLTRLIGAERSRRGVLKAVAGGAIGAMAAGVGLDRAEAAPRHRAVGNSCAKNSDCASGLCVQEARTRKIFHCQSAADCPGGDACHVVSCVAGACVATALGGVGCPCTPPRYWDGHQDVDPIGFPGTGCIAGLVCHNDATCDINRPPGAMDIDVKHPWMFNCIPVTLVGYEPDNDALYFEIVTPPQHGFLTDFLEDPSAIRYTAPAPAGARARALLADDPGCIPYTAGPFYGIDQPHVCPNCLCPGCLLGGGTDNLPGEWGNTTHPTGYSCPEGGYYYRTLCYETNSPTFTGTDSFTYVAIDPFGGRSAPAVATITVFQT